MKKSHFLLALARGLVCILPLGNVCVGYDPGAPDTVRFGELILHVTGPPYQGTAILPVLVFNDEALRDIEIPLIWDGPLVCDSGRFVGERSQYLGIANVVPWEDTSIVYAYALAGEDDVLIPSGEGEFLRLYFSVTDTGRCYVDTVSLYGWMYLFFVDSLYEEVNPTFLPGEYLIEPTLSGDVNGDGLVDIGDVVWLLNYLFKGDPPPEPLDRGDANGDCDIDLGDVICLLNYLYRSGPAPQSGCLR
jgi:hypothetical protein